MGNNDLTHPHDTAYFHAERRHIPATVLAYDTAQSMRVDRMATAVEIPDGELETVGDFKFS